MKSTRENAIDRLDQAFIGLTDGSIDGMLFMSTFRAQLKLFAVEGGIVDITYWFKKLLKTLPLAPSVSDEVHADVDADYDKSFDTLSLPVCEKARHEPSLDKCLGTALRREDWIKLSYGDKSDQFIFAGSLLPIRLGFESLFVQWSDEEAHDMRMSCLRKSICLADTELEASNPEEDHHPYIRQNLHYLQNNLTLWHNIVAFGGLRLPFVDVAPSVS